MLVSYLLIWGFVYQRFWVKGNYSFLRNATMTKISTIGIIFGPIRALSLSMLNKIKSFKRISFAIMSFGPMIALKNISSYFRD